MIRQSELTSTVHSKRRWPRTRWARRVLGGAATLLGTVPLWALDLSTASADSHSCNPAWAPALQICLNATGDGHHMDILDAYIQTGADQRCGHWSLNFDHDDGTTTHLDSPHFCYDATGGYGYRWKTNVDVDPTTHRLCTTFFEDNHPTVDDGWACVDLE